MRLNFWPKFRAWVMENYQEKNEAEATDLVWLRRTLRPGEKLHWCFVDTVDYQLDSLPRRRELVMDFKVKPKEVAKGCPILLNWKKER